jgi:hypothetical protein
VSNHHWESIARIALDAAYEATIWAGVASSNRQRDILSQDQTTDGIASKVVSKFQMEPGCTEIRPDSDTQQPHTIFLTLLGGGVFGNEPAWIAGAIGRAVAMAVHANANVRILICHFRAVDEDMKAMIDMCVEMELEGLRKRSTVRSTIASAQQ